MNQNFTSDQLLKLCTGHELRTCAGGKGSLVSTLDKFYDRIIEGCFDLDLKSKSDYIHVKGDKTKPENLAHSLILRKLNDNIKRIYKEEQANRRLIISQLKVLLEESCPKWIIRSDIKSFYESINHNRILSKLHDDCLLSYHSLKLLHNVFDNPCYAGAGLPRGLCISSTMSEIYMRNFDRWIRQCTGVYYYARFVDDIIILCSSKDSADAIIKTLPSQLDDICCLKINTKKHYLLDEQALINGDKLEYLGYQFRYEMRNNKRVLSISIADKKIKKIKNRIIRSLTQFVKTGDFALLENRLKFLTGNYSIKKREKTNDLKAGIYYNYSLINNFSCLEELDAFFHKALYSTNKSFGRRISGALDAIQKERLSRFSFKYGFHNKLHYPFSGADIQKINNCWQ